MSLVSEALKKAEREAAARDARAKGQTPPAEMPRQPYRAPRGSRSGARIAPRLLFALGLIAGIGGYLGLRRAPDAVPVPEAVQPAATPAPAASVPEPGLAAASPAAEPVAATTATASSNETRESTGSETASPGVTRSAAARPPAGAGADAVAPRPSPDSTPAAGNGGRAPREFVRTVELESGGRLTLGGIAYSDTAPFAYLNGKLLKAGESVAGYTLERIDRDQVVVRGEGREIVIRLKAR